MQSNGAEAFTAAMESARVAAIHSVERAMPNASRALLSTLLADYYESPPVLTAMGWRAEPPQLGGHAMPEQVAMTAERLNRVRSRGKLWRG
jgi:hypothetical protein